MLISAQAHSQCPKYSQAIKAGKSFLSQKAFDKAIVEFQTAQIAARECKQSKNEPAILLKKAFDGIQEQRDRAIEAGKKALVAKQSAIKAKQQAELARSQADSSRDKANLLKNLAIKHQEETIVLNEELSSKKKQSSKLVKGIYFYANNYGLGFNKESQRFYYFDTLGKAHFQEEDLSFYEASQFNRYGYARVRVDKTTSYSSYFDTLVFFYPIAEKKYQINEKTAFIDLSGKDLSKIPSDVWEKGITEVLGNKTSPIKSLELRNNHIYGISNKIRHLKHLEVLDLADNSLDRLPKGIIELKELTTIYFSNETSYLNYGNHIGRLPTEIGNLEDLQRLNMSYHHLSRLPSSFSKLQTLEELNLRKNKFSRFPSEILDLDNLKKLDLSGNKIKKLPANLSTMKSLKVLNLAGNPIAESEIANLKKSFPNLQIIETDSTLRKRGHLLSFGIGISLSGYNLKGKSTNIDFSSNLYDFIIINHSINYQIGEYGLSFFYKTVSFRAEYLEDKFVAYLLGHEDTNIELKAFINKPSMIKTSLGVGIINLIGNFDYSDYSDYIKYSVSERKIPNFYFTGSVEYLFTKKRKQNHGGLQLSFAIFQKGETDENVKLFLSRLSIGYTYYFGKVLNFNK